ncbi:hypothetical protein CTZ27_09235 [Streptomyces griseocarneus]|nr:hypothetical protein CTZ27_09235 [Streptomyces griseocarneus]
MPQPQPQQRRRPSAAIVLLLLLAVVICPSLAGTGTVAYAAGTSTAVASPTNPPTATPESMAPHVDGGLGTGGTCKPQEAPLSGTQAVVAHPQTDPLTGPGGTTRGTLPSGHLPRPGVPRAPPVPMAGCAELLPVLRI